MHTAVRTVCIVDLRTPRWLQRPLTRSPRLSPLPEQKTIAKGPVKKGGYKNYCKAIREEWKKKGEKVPVPEQGKRLCVNARFQPQFCPMRLPPRLLNLSCIFRWLFRTRLRSGAGWKALSEAEKDKYMD